MRFKTSCEWKKYKLKELSKIFDGTHQTPDYKDHGISFVSVEDIDDLYSTSKFITKDAFTRDFKIYPQKNDILMTRIGDIGTPALVTKEQPLAYYVSLALIKPTNNLNSTFAKYMIESKSFQHELWKKTIHVAFPKKINKEEIGECLCFAPNINYQRKIGQFLLLIDERIGTQNKIIEKYKSLIKPLFETLNSNTNINIAIKELGPYVSADLLSWNDMNHVGEPAIIYGQLFTDYKYIIEKVISKTERKIKTKTKDNDLLFPSSTTVDSLSLIAPSSIKIPGVIIGGDMFKIELDKEKFDSDYISFLINCSLNKKIAKYAQGSTIIHLHYEDIKLFQMKICGIEKQKEISKQMKVLLEKISVERSIMELLLKQKKYFLANLFI